LNKVDAENNCDNNGSEGRVSEIEHAPGKDFPLVLNPL
jgi:hypothetical protein